MKTETRLEAATKAVNRIFDSMTGVYEDDVKTALLKGYSAGYRAAVADMNVILQRRRIAANKAIRSGRAVSMSLKREVK